MSDCFDHAFQAYDSMDYERDHSNDYARVSSGPARRSKPVSSAWVQTDIKAKDIDGRAHVEVDGTWCKLNIPTFVKGSRLCVKRDFYIDDAHLLANNIKGYYDDAGRTEWVDTEYKGTKMGNTVYAWANDDWIPVSGPAWVHPESGLIRVPRGVKINEIIKFTY